MQEGFKLFGEKDTGSFHERLLRTRSSLTLIYIALLVVILFISGAVTRAVFSQRLDRRFAVVIQGGDRLRPVLLPIDAENLRADLLSTLFLVNGALVIFSAIASYWLATRTLKPIQDAYEGQRQFLSDASHELRTPLAILQANLENERDGGSADLRKSAESHLEEVTRMSTLVRDVLSLSRLEHAADDLVLVPLVLNDVLQKVVDRLAAIATQQTITLVLHDAEETFFVLATEEPLIRLFTNILENAILYNRPEGSVTITMYRIGGDVITNMADTGVGIAKADVEKIFDRFYRADKSRSRRTGGSGLGLSIARSILESFHGRIIIESDVNVGTTVRISLPIHVASSLLHG